jgi:hypothetical protein
MLEKVFLQENNGTITYRSYFNAILFLPIAVFRLVSEAIPKKWIRKGTGADNHVFSQESIASRWLFQIFSMEKPLLKAGMTFPFGVSAMLCWKMKK